MTSTIWSRQSAWEVEKAEPPMTAAQPTSSGVIDTAITDLTGWDPTIKQMMARWRYRWPTVRDKVILRCSLTTPPILEIIGEGELMGDSFWKVDQPQ